MIAFALLPTYSWLPSTVTVSKPSSPTNAPFVIDEPELVSAVPSYVLLSLFAVTVIATGVIVSRPFAGVIS